ncbi:Putative WD-repeat family protein [Giardia duodenalis]|uniref:Putative WD-repeat family protein n=1 Tax=Giardia intestinalis TaxID=5741 RepID=V6TJ53_GIAIN|nr:Putative WD-repeat family protein [Giardia intestinalis]
MATPLGLLSPLEQSWLRFLHTVHLSDPTYSFQKIFTHLPSRHLISLQSKFDNAPGGCLSCSEFVSAIASSREIFASINERGTTGLKRLARVLNSYISIYNDDVHGGNKFLARLRALILIFNHIDITRVNKLSWADFSNFLSSFVTPALAISNSHVATIYNTSIYSKYLLSTKILEPIYSVSYSSEADAFLACCRDNNVHILDSSTFLRQAILQEHKALPVVATSFKPAIEGFNHAKNRSQPGNGRRVIGGFNYITSGADRKIIIWNGIAHTPVSILPTENIHTALATIDELHYRKSSLSPAIFSGDDHGNVHFWKLTEQHIPQQASPTRTYKKFNSEEPTNVSLIRDMYFAKRSKDPSQQVQPKAHLRTSSKQPRPSDFFLKSDAQADETKRTADTLVAGIDASAINDELEDDSHGTAVQFYNSMTSARRKPNSSVLKEDAENLILFYDMKNFSGHVPFAEGYNLSFFLEDSDDWKKASGEYQQDTYKYDAVLTRLFNDTFEASNIAAPTPEFTELAKRMATAIQAKDPPDSAANNGLFSAASNMNEQKLTLAESNVYIHNQRQTDSSTSSQDSDESTGFSDDSDDDSIKQVQRNKALIQKHMATNRRRQKYIQNSFKSMGTQELAPIPIWTIKAHKDWVTCLCLDTVTSNNSTILASGGADGLINVYDINRGVANSNLHFHKDSITGLAWLHRRGLLAACSHDRKLTLWSLGTSNTKPVSVISTSDAPYVGVFSHKLKSEIVSVDATGKVAVYDVRRMEPIHTIGNNMAKTGRIVSAAYNGYTGLISTVGRTINYVVPVNEDDTHRCSLSPINVWCCSPTAPIVLFVSDGSLQFWDMLYGKLLRSVSHVFTPSLYFRSKEIERNTREMLDLPHLDVEETRSAMKTSAASYNLFNFLPPIGKDDVGKSGSSRGAHKQSFSYNSNYDKLKKTKEGALGYIDSRLNNSDEAQMYQKNVSNLFNTDFFGEINLKQLSLDNIRELHNQEQQFLKKLEKGDCGTVTFGLECTAIALSSDTNVYGVAMTDGRVTLYERVTDKVLMKIRYTSAYHDQKQLHMEQYFDAIGVKMESQLDRVVSSDSLCSGVDWSGSKASKGMRVRQLAAAAKDDFHKEAGEGASSAEANLYDDEPCTNLFFSEHLTPLCVHHHGLGAMNSNAKSMVNEAQLSLKSMEEGSSTQQVVASATIATQESTFTPMIVWLFFKQSARVYTYRIAKDQPYLLGRLKLRSSWTDITPCHDLNVVHIYMNTEVYTLNADSVMLAKAEVSLVDAKQTTLDAARAAAAAFKLEIKFILTPGERFQLWILSCGLILVVHIKTGFLLAALSIPNLIYCAYVSCMEEFDSLVVLDHLGQLHFYDISEIISLVTKFEKVFMLTMPKGSSYANFASAVHFINTLSAQRTGEGLYAPSDNLEFMTKASENLKRSYPVTSDMLSTESPAPIQVQVSTNFLTKRHYFTVFDVMPRDRYIFSSTVEPIIWEIVDLCNNNLNMKQINTNLKTRSLLPEEKAWYSGHPVIVCPKLLNTISTVPFLIDLDKGNIDDKLDSDTTKSTKVLTQLSNFGIISIQAIRVIGLYLCVCTTGYILAFDAREACYLCTLVHRGWPQKIKKYLRYNLNTATPNRIQRQLLNRFISEEKKSVYLHAYVSDQIKEQLKQMELESLNASVSSSTMVGGLSSITLKTPQGSRLNKVQTLFPTPMLGEVQTPLEETCSDERDQLNTTRSVANSKRNLTIITRNKDGTLLTSAPTAFTPYSFGKLIGASAPISDVRLLTRPDAPFQPKDLGVGKFLIQSCISDIKKTAFKQLSPSERASMAKGYTKSMNRTKSAMTHLVALDTSLKELYKSKTGASPMRVPLSSLDGKVGKTSSILGASLKEKNVDLTRSMLDIPDQDTQQEEGMQESEVNKILGRASGTVKSLDSTGTRLDLTAIVSRRTSSIFNRENSPVRKMRASTVGATEQLTPRVPENIVESETSMQESTAVPPSAISETYDILSMQKQDIAMCYKKKMTTINGGYVNYSAIKK